MYRPAHLYRALLLQPEAYRRVAARRHGSDVSSVLFVLIVYGLLAGWAMWLDRASGAGFETAAAIAIWGLLRWVLVALLLWFVGIHGFEGEGNLGEMFRATALAHVPLLLQIMPLEVRFANVVAAVWFVLALVVAAQAVLGLSIRRAAGTGVMAAAGLLIVSNVFLIPVAIFGVV
jgi:hypothetical protein